MVFFYENPLLLSGLNNKKKKKTIMALHFPIIILFECNNSDV